MLDNSEKIELYIHLGFQKTGTTVLQNQIFPILDGVYYVGKPFKNQNWIQDFMDSGQKKILVSSESFIGRLTDSYRTPSVRFDELQIDGIKRMHSLFPNARIIIGVREHRAYIESVYKHYLKYGGCKKLEDFYMPGKKTGVMTDADFRFSPKLEVIKTLFSGTPLVIDQGKLLKDPKSEISRLANWMGCKVSVPQRLLKENVGAGAEEAWVLRKLNTAPSLRRVVLSRFWSKANIRWINALAKIAPDSVDKIRYEGAAAEEIDAIFRDDWLTTKKYF